MTASPASPTPDVSSGQPKPPSRMSRALAKIRWVGGIAVAATFALLIAWQIGVQGGRRERDRIEAERDAALSRLNLLEARRLLHEAIVQLEARNFGSAQERVERAAQFLAAGQVADAKEGEDTLLTQVREFRTQVEPDVGKQVARLLHFARALDDRSPPPAVPFGVAAPAEEGAEADSAPNR